MNFKGPTLCLEIPSNHLSVRYVELLNLEYPMAPGQESATFDSLGLLLEH
jgi:hypothetical protein